MSAKLFLHLSFFLFLSVHANFLRFCPYFFLPIFCPAKKSKALRTFTNREMVIFYPPPPSLFPFITFSSLSLSLSFTHISHSLPLSVSMFIHLLIPLTLTLLVAISFSQYLPTQVFPFFKKMGHPRPLFRLFSVFSRNITILQQIYVKNVHPVYSDEIRTHNFGT